MAHKACGARFFDGVKRNSSSIGRDRWENSVSDLFLTDTVKVGDVNRIVALERDVPITAKTEAGDAAKAKSSAMILLMAMQV